MSALDDALYYGRQCIGGVYGWWGGGALEYWAPMFTYAPGLTPSDVYNTSCNCAGIINAMTNMGTGDPNQPYGTLAWGDHMSESFDASRWYKVGTIVLEPFGGGSEGHVVIVSTPGQYCLQSNTARGITESVLLATQHAYTPFSYAGWHPTLPSSSTFPGGADGGSISVAGYPGDYSTPREWAKWMGRVASSIHGLPAALPVMTSMAEVYCWSQGGADDYVDVSTLPGMYTYADNDSLGWFQQRVMYYGSGVTNAEYALAKFLDRALEVGPYPLTAQGLGEWAQAIQRSAYPERYATHYEEAIALIGDMPTPIPDPTPPPPKEDVLVFEPYNFIAPAGEGPERAYAWAAGAALNSFGLQTLTITDEKNAQAAKAAASKDIKVYEIGPGDDVVTLRGVRNQILPLIAREQGIASLLDRFDSILLATDKDKFSPILDEAKKPGEEPPPPPRPPMWQERGWVQSNFSDEKRLRFVAEGSSYADPWAELTKLDEVGEEDLVIVWRGK